jgi:hypothetical protein
LQPVVLRNGFHPSAITSIPYCLHSSMTLRTSAASREESGSRAIKWRSSLSVSSSRSRK